MTNEATVRLKINEMLEKAGWRLVGRDANENHANYYYQYLKLNRDKIVTELAKRSNKKVINQKKFSNLLIPNIAIKK